MAGTASSNAFDHSDFHPALRGPVNFHVVHEAANQEYAAAARFEQILRRQRIGNRGWIEAFAFIPNPDGQDPASGVSSRIPGRKLDEDVFAGVVAVAMFDGVDDALADRNPDIMPAVIVQTNSASDMVAHDLHKIEHFERAGELEPHNH